MSTIRDDGRATERRTHEPTSVSAWQAMFGSSITDELLEWPPDLFALVNLILEGSEAFRFAPLPARRMAAASRSKLGRRGRGRGPALLPVLRQALKDRRLMGEVCGVMRDVFGEDKPAF
jgi:hypothetical protein